MFVSMRHDVRDFRRAVTLIEILVVMSIIALLVSIVLPSLTAVREIARTTVCMANQQAAVLGLTSLAMDDGDTYPAAYLPEGAGYSTWAGMLVEKGLLSSDGFTCPEFEHGGLPAANPAGGFFESAQVAESSGAVDNAPERCAFTVNEAVCPRPRFTAGEDGVIRTSRRVNFAEVESDVILLTEFATDWRVLSPGNDTCRSYMPIHGLIGIGVRSSDKYDLNAVIASDSRPCFANGYYLEYSYEHLVAEPVANLKAPARLNMVGRNHGKADSAGFRRTTMAFVDGHVVNESLTETIETTSWGHIVYSINGDQRINSAWSGQK